jgi:hypothetical protein
MPLHTLACAVTTTACGWLVAAKSSHTSSSHASVVFKHVGTEACPGGLPQVDATPQGCLVQHKGAAGAQEVALYSRHSTLHRDVDLERCSVPDR